MLELGALHMFYFVLTDKSEVKLRCATCGMRIYAVTSKRCEIGYELIRSLYIFSVWVLKSVTLNDFHRCNGRYFTLFYRIC